MLLDLTDVSDGNALGIGFADFIPASLANKIDFRQTYINCFTAGPAGMRRSRLPMVLPDEESCIKAALTMCGRGPEEAEARRADQVDPAPHEVLGQRRPAPVDPQDLDKLRFASHYWRRRRPMTRGE